jgi:LPS export ABC transporter protein LptC
MASWQRRARLFTAVAGIAFAVALAFAFRTTPPSVIPAVVERSDPSAVLETAGGRTLRINRDREEIRIEYDKLLTYSDGSTRLQGVTVTTARGEGTFVVKGDSAQVGEKESRVELEGHVEINGSEGLVMKTDRATYSESDATVRVPGAVEFSRGRMSGTSMGLTYDKNADVMSLLDQAVVHVTSEGDDEAMHILAGSVEMRRPEHLLRFDRDVRVDRGLRTITSDNIVAHLLADDSTLDALELRGAAHVVDKPVSPGGLESMSSRDMDLKFDADGRTLDHARLMSDAVVQLGGPSGQAGRRISADNLEISLSGGSTVTGLSARDNVRLQMPPDSPTDAERTIQSQNLDGSGDAVQGLRRAVFGGDVRFRERSQTADRSAHAGVLELALAPGFGAIQDARFSKVVKFADGDMMADAATARYALDKGTLELGGREPGRQRPHVTHQRFSVDATAITITLEGPTVAATGDVKSVLAAQSAKPATGDSPERHVPSMLKRDQAVNVTAADLRYDGKASTATYSGNAWLWQGDTSIKAGTLFLNDARGDMTGNGSVITSIVMTQTNQQGQKERSRSITTAKEFLYEESVRRATYTGDAHMNSAQGDMTAAKIEVFLEPSGDEVERAEAYEGVTLREKRRKATGARLTYHSSDERYVMTGSPVTILDECARETTGRTLTFYRTTDRIVVDGSEQIRTQTKGGSQCPG